MIFNIIEKGVYKSGDIKTIKKFSIFPTKINSTTIIWLEKYFVQYKLYEKRYFDYNGMICTEKYWNEINRYIEE
jgi:hypothetical protein